jgi:tRNA-splicing endonuclease subunit Sen15, fungi type
MALRSSIVA